MTKAHQTPTKHPSETKTAGVSFVNVLDSNESLTGTPTVSSSPSGLTISNVQRNGSALTINGASVAANKAVLFSIAGGESGAQYELEVQCATDGSPAQILIIECKLIVQNG